MTKKITALIILDGYGVGACDKNTNAIYADGSKFISRYKKEFPHTTLLASGIDVGLPDGQMGNSEVGHLNIGAGRVVYQELTRITKSIADGDFFRNAAFLDAIDYVKAHGTKLHLMGLCSDGGVHSHLEQAYALIRLAKEKGLEDVYVHCFMDGRDVPPSSGKDFIAALEREMQKENFGQIATVMGRYYAMDRDNRYDRVEKAYNAMTLGEGQTAHSALEAMENSYAADTVDEFVLPTVIIKNGEPIAKVEPHDVVIFYNFRPDRAREITRSYIAPDFDGFARKNGYFSVKFVCMTQYDKLFAQYDELSVAFLPQSLENTLGEYLSKNGRTQLRIAETEKYAHVTFFFNGGVEAPNDGEDRDLIPSPKVATYDLQPEMSAYIVAQNAVERINSGKYDLMVLNFANADMVGHTGVMDAAVAAVHAVDECVHTVVEAIRNQGGRCIITADHGNCEKMLDLQTGGAFTAHTTNPVPLLYIDDANRTWKLRQDGRLADIAPTLLDMLELPVPPQMTGTSLLLK